MVKLEAGALLIETVNGWVQRVNELELIPGRLLPTCTMHFSLECFAREWIVTKPRTPTSFCGCLVARVVCVVEGLSNDIRRAVANMVVRVTFRCCSTGSRLLVV